MLVSTLFALAAATALALSPAPIASPGQAGGSAADQESETLRQGRERLAAGDHAGALELFERALEEDPEDGRAWLLLGAALQASGDAALALEVFERAAGFPETKAGACYRAGGACAQLGRIDAAFGWLRRAKDAGFANVGRLANDPALAALRADPRFQELLPIGQDLSFAEEVEVLLELRGEAPGDRFGWIGRNAGDVDGDGRADLLLSAPFHGAGGTAAGKLYVVSSGTGATLWTVTGSAGEQLGIGIEGAGDLDGDGVPDVLAGASGAFGTGAARAFSGADGRQLFEWKGSGQGDQFGRKVAGTGDLDGDGVGDVIVGAPYHDATGADAGRATVFSGRDGRVLCHLDGEAPGDLFGRSVDGHAGSDGRLLIVGASSAGPGGRGRVHVFRVPAPKSAGDALPELVPAEHFRIEGRDGDRQLGLMFVSAVGDVNGDGAMDVYAADWGSNAEGLAGSGRVYVHSGQDGALLHTWSGETAGEGFGIGTAEAGDVDGDGCADLLVGAWQHGSGAPGGGRCRLFSGRTGAVLATYTCTTPAETFGFDTTGLGDVNGDGMPDFLVTNADSYVSGVNSGRVVILAGPTRE